MIGDLLLVAYRLLPIAYCFIRPIAQLPSRS